MHASEIKFTGSGVVSGEHGDAPQPETGRTEFALQWNDNSSVALSASFTRYLMGRPSLDDVTRFLVALLCAPVGALGAAVASTNGTQVNTIAQYVELVPGWPSDEGLPLLAARIAEAPLVMDRAVPAIWTDSDAVPGQAVTIWPLGTSSGSVHTLVLLHATGLNLTHVKQRVKDLAEILAVYLLSPPRVSRDADFVSVDAGRTAAASLTSRQCQVIELMAQGLTNRQIAGRIGFSESTVHLEGLAAYRALGVHTRQGAVTAARALGLIAPAEPPLNHRATA